MKRVILTISLIVSVIMVTAQSFNVQSAANESKKGRFEKALGYIEAAVKDPSTKADPKAWYYRGQIYWGIGKSENPKVQVLAENALDTAMESYMNVVELEKDMKNKEFTDMAAYDMSNMATDFYNTAVKSYQAGGFDTALDNFDKAFTVKGMFGVVDTLSLYYGGLTSIQLKKYKEAIEHFTPLADMKWKNEGLYGQLYGLYVLEESGVKDFDKAAKYLADGLAMFPKSVTLLEIAGTEYERLGEFDKAKQTYESILATNPNNYNVLYNLGALYFNKGADINNKANNLPFGDESYDAMVAESTKYFEMAAPLFEELNKLTPNDKIILVSLKDIYTRLKKYDKVKEIDVMIQAL